MRSPKCLAWPRGFKHPILTSRCPQGKETRNAYQSSITVDVETAPSAYPSLCPHRGVNRFGIKKTVECIESEMKSVRFLKKQPKLNFKNGLVIRTLPDSHILVYEHTSIKLLCATLWEYQHRYRLSNLAEAKLHCMCYYHIKQTNKQTQNNLSLFTP